MRRLSPLTRVAAVVVALEVLVIVLARFTAPYPLAEQFPLAILQGPSRAHLLGTDNLGDDLLTQVIWGGQASLVIAAAATAGSTFLGLGLGLLSSIRKLDFWASRITDTVMAFPAILLALAVLGALGAGLWTEVIAMSIAFSPYMARIVRSEALRIRELAFVEAAYASGAGQVRILFRHILPSAMTPIVTQATYTFARSIILDAALGYLGLGVPPPTVSWGNILANAQPYIATSWWFWAAPSFAIVVTALCLTVIGQSLSGTVPGAGIAGVGPSVTRGLPTAEGEEEVASGTQAGV